MTKEADQLRAAAAKVRQSANRYGDGRHYQRLIVALLDSEALADLLESEAGEVERTGRVKTSVWTLADGIERYNIQ